MQESSSKNSLENILNGLKGMFDTKTIVGEPVAVQDATIIPLIEITCGMGIGDFEDKNAGGFGTKLTPVALVVVQKGMTKVINIKHVDPLTKLIELLPDLINDVVGQNNFSKQLNNEIRKINESNR